MTTEETPPLDAKLTATLEELSTLAKEVSEPRSALGDINFEQSFTIFAQLRELANDLLPLDLAALPEADCNAIEGSARGAITALETVRDFVLDPPQPKPTPNQKNPPVVQPPTVRRDLAVKSVTTHYDNLYKAANSRIAFLVLRSAPALQSQLAAVEKLTKDASHHLGESERLRQNTSAKLGVSEFAQDFKTVADNSRDQARLWLSATVTIGVIAIITACTVNPSGDWSVPKEAAANTRGLLVRLVVLSFLSYGITLTARNYRALRHLEVLNRHRQNALSTFDRFVDAAGKADEVRHAVLLAATQAVFSAGASGHLSSKDQGPSPLPAVGTLASNVSRMASRDS